MVHQTSMTEQPAPVVRRGSQRRLSATEVVLKVDAQMLKSKLEEARVHDVVLSPAPVAGQNHCSIMGLGSWCQVVEQENDLQSGKDTISCGDFLRSNDQSVWAVADLDGNSNSHTVAVRGFVSYCGFPVVPLDVTGKLAGVVEMYTDFARRCPEELKKIVLVVDCEHVAIRRHFGDMLTVQQFLHPRNIGLIWLDFTDSDQPRASFEWVHEGNKVMASRKDSE